MAGAAGHSPAEVIPLSPSSARAVTCRLSPAPIAAQVQEQHLLLLIATKHRGLASNQPELVLYEPLTGLQRKVLNPSTFPCVI